MDKLNLEARSAGCRLRVSTDAAALEADEATKEAKVAWALLGEAKRFERLAALVSEPVLAASLNAWARLFRSEALKRQQH